MPATTANPAGPQVLPIGNAIAAAQPVIATSELEQKQALAIVSQYEIDTAITNYPGRAA